ncbi:sulfurtransferase complex subunit TusB [Psychromonas sp. CD1]|uniref:sulfurtransferase complex subunit TusB n=1 Tax=Psychromonas sp. CD1 TaxID=1979839 RepID=UPI000B9BF84E|nr:sulfurtransferase complex subunit TusB [Psychromonas sp. CD1]
MILHTIHSSPLDSFALQQCLALLSANDTLLLIEDGVFASQARHPWLVALETLSKQGRLRVLSSDLKARGIENKIGEKCSYSDFVILVAKHTSLMPW